MIRKTASGESIEIDTYEDMTHMYHIIKKFAIECSETTLCGMRRAINVWLMQKERKAYEDYDYWK